MSFGDVAAGLGQAMRRVDKDTIRIAVDIEDATGVTLNATVSGVAGDVAHDAADSGNPLKIGGKGSAAAPAAVTEGDRVNASYTLVGSARVLDDNSAAAAASLALLDDVVLVDDAAFTPATSKVVAVGFQADETASDSVDEGDIGAARMTLDRKQITAAQSLDDSAFGVATGYVEAVGLLADETATDSVDEGDVGIPRMTLDRRAITAGQILDDAALGIGTSYVTPAGFLADETATDSVDEGDVGAPRMTLNRRAITAGNHLDDAAFGIGTEYITTIGAVADETSPDSVDEGDTGAVRMTLDRRLRVANRSSNGPGEPGTAVDSMLHAAISASANTADQVLVAAPGANKQIWVYGFVATSTLAGSMSLQDEDNVAITGVMPFGATGGVVLPMSGNFSMPLFKVATNKALEIDTVTGDAKGIISYSVVSV